MMSVSEKRMNAFLNAGLHKGNRIDNGEIICGGLESCSGHYYICGFEVAPKTIRHEIGLKFRDGKPIFEYDIIAIGEGDFY